MAFRDNLAKLRGLAGEKGYQLEKGPISGTWFLINEENGQLAVSDRGTRHSRSSGRSGFYPPQRK